MITIFSLVLWFSVVALSSLLVFVRCCGCPCYCVGDCVWNGYGHFVCVRSCFCYSFDRALVIVIGPVLVIVSDVDCVLDVISPSVCVMCLVLLYFGSYCMCYRFVLLLIFVFVIDDVLVIMCVFAIVIVHCVMSSSVCCVLVIVVVICFLVLRLWLFMLLVWEVL